MSVLRLGETLTLWSAACSTFTAGDASAVAEVQAGDVRGYATFDLSFDTAPTAIGIDLEVSEAGGIWKKLGSFSNVLGGRFVCIFAPGQYRGKITSITGTTEVLTLTLVLSIARPTEMAGTIQLTDPTPVGSSFIRVGANPDATGMEVGANSGRVDGIAVNLTNALATLSGFFTGINIELTNSGVGVEYMCGGQFNVFKTGGVSTSGHNMTGIRARCQISAGTTPGNVMVINAKQIIYPSVVVGGDSGHISIATAGYFTSDIHGTADIGDALATSALHAELIGNNSIGAGDKHKHTGVIVACMSGDSAKITCGAFFKCRRQNSMGAAMADYGLDLYDDLSGAFLANAFAVGDIRLGGSVGPVIMQYTADPNGVLTRPKGSLCIDTTNATLYQNDDGGTTWTVTST